jgi:hypothetical protein
MNKIRCFFVSIVLLATLSGLSLQGSVANAAASQHASAPFVAGKSTRLVAVRFDPPCGGAWDC